MKARVFGLDRCSGADGGGRPCSGLRASGSIAADALDRRDLDEPEDEDRALESDL